MAATERLLMTRLQAKARLYANYYEQMAPKPSQRAVITRQYDSWFRRLLPAARETSIADIGCGEGSFLRYLQERGFTAVTGVDGSAVQVAAAHAAGLSEVQHGGAVEFLSERESMFDVISAQNILEHLTLEELLETLDACFNSLKPGGRLWIVVPNGLSPLGVSVRYSDLTHELCFTPQSISQAVFSCGFQRVEVREIGQPIVHGVKSLVRLILWKGIRGCLHLWRLVEFGEAGPAAVYTHDMLVIATKL